MPAVTVAQKNPPYNPPEGSTAPKLSPHQEARLRSSRMREAKLRLAQERAAREVEAEARNRSATSALELAFDGILDRSVGQIDPQWVIDRLAELGIAAARQSDLPTVRAVLGDFMKH